MNLFDLAGVGMIRHGIPTDVVRGSDQTYSRLLSAAIHRSASGFDGVLYQSRFTGGNCIAFFDSARFKVRIEDEVRLADIEGTMGDIYRRMNIAVRRP
jgi:hypothetical protein